MDITITVSGPSHSGKSEICRILHEYLQQEFLLDVDTVTNDGNELDHIQNVDFSKIRLHIAEEVVDPQMDLFSNT